MSMMKISDFGPQISYSPNACMVSLVGGPLGGQRYLVDSLLIDSISFADCERGQFATYEPDGTRGETKRYKFKGYDGKCPKTRSHAEDG